MKILLLTILLLSFGQAQAQAVSTYLTGSTLLERCEASKGNICMGYVMGIADVHVAFTSWKDMNKYWCTPKGIHSSQLVRVVVKYLQKHPEQLHMAAGSLVANALDDAFPCGGES